MSAPRTDPAYLGDGVYACVEAGMIKLWTSNGVENSPPIYLEPEVMKALNEYAQQIGMRFK